MSLAESCRFFSSDCLSCICSSFKRGSRPAVKRCRVLADNASRLLLTSRPACSSSAVSFWLSAPRRASRSDSNAVTVLRVSATATKTCTKRAIPRVTNTGRSRRLCNSERTADTENPPLRCHYFDSTLIDGFHSKGRAAQQAETTKGPEGPFVLHQQRLKRTGDAERWSRCGPGQSK